MGVVVRLRILRTWLSQTVCNMVFPGLVCYFFLIFCMQLGFSKHVKVTVCFLRKVLIIPKIGKWGIFGFKWTFSSFPLSLVIRFFWICTWWQGLKWIKVRLWICMDNSHYVQNGVKMSFLGQTQYLQSFYRIGSKVTD